MKPEELLAAFRKAVVSMEARLEVKCEVILIHKDEFEVMSQWKDWRQSFDIETHREVIDWFTHHYFGDYHGVLWGAQLYSTVAIPPGGIVCLPASEHLAEALVPGLKMPKNPTLWEHLDESE